MTVQQKADWLGRYLRSRERQQMLGMELAEEKTRAEGLGGWGGGMPHGGPNIDRLPRAVERVEKLEKRVEQEKEYGKKCAEALEIAIDREEDPRVRTIMRLRFIEGANWDEVAATLHLEKRWVQRLLNGAIVTLKVPRVVRKERDARLEG